MYKLIVIITIIVVAVIAVQQVLFSNDFDLPKKGKTVTETVVIEDGQVVEPINNKQKTINSKEKDFQEVALEKEVEIKKEVKEIMVTDSVKHSVPLDDILGGGPPKDGIPSIDNPKFVSIKEAQEFLSDNEPGIAVSFNGIDRFYPFQILVWHEIVNDIFGDQRLLVTYCPLCLSGIVFDPVVKGERVEFGTSGKLWNSNLVMYDRKTDSLWSQILGEAIVGDMTGNELKVLPSDQMRFKEWRALHSNGQVLSRDTGAKRFYGTDPYGDYYTDNNALLFSVGKGDSRLENKDFVLGIVINGKAKAYWPPAIKKAIEVEDNFAGKSLIIKYESNIDAVRIFEKKSNGELERINPFPNFWFSWVAAHPDTELFK